MSLLEEAKNLKKHYRLSFIDNEMEELTLGVLKHEIGFAEFRNVIEQQKKGRGATAYVMFTRAIIQLNDRGTIKII